MEIRFIVDEVPIEIENWTYQANIEDLIGYTKPFRHPIQPPDESRDLQNSPFDMATLKIVKMLEVDKCFEKKVKRIRKHFKEPEMGYRSVSSSPYRLPLRPNDPSRSPYFTPEVRLEGMESLREHSRYIQEYFDKVNKYAISELHEFLFPSAIKENLYSIILFNAIGASTEYKFSVENDQKDRVRITIDIFAPMVSSNRIKNDIDEHWSEINRILSEDKVYVKKLPEWENIEIWRLKNESSMTSKEIARHINAKYNKKHKKYKLNLDELAVNKRFSTLKKQYRQIRPSYK